MKRKFLMPKRTNLDNKILNDLKNDSRLHNLNSFAIEILFNRGFKTVEDIEKHLYSNLDYLHPTYLMKDSSKFVEVVMDSIEKGEEITNISDYDVDGTLSSSTLVLGIKNAGGNINYFTSNRFDEGYGISPECVDNMLKQFPNTKLIITTDNGIVAHAGIDYANSLGIKVVVTDHHEQGSVLPNALAVVDPKRKDEDYPFDGLCGAGVVFKLLLQLYWEMGLDLDYVYSLLDLVAVATVGDLVPLIDENRIIVKEGIKLVKYEDRIVFKKLRETLNIKKVDEDTFGYTYCPLINALGRIQGGQALGIELFTTTDEDRMDFIIKELFDLNEYRKELTEKQEKLGIEMVEKQKEVPNVIVLYDKTFHEGVVGLVAGRLKEKYNRPTIVLASHEKEIKLENGAIEIHKEIKGSARSIEGFHIKNVLDSLSSYLTKYGGHAMAGGLGLLEENLEDFTSAINKKADELLTEEDYVKKVHIDVVIPAKDITVEFIEELDMLKPFGMGYSKPRFGLDGFVLDRSASKKIYCGSDENTVRLVGQTGLTVMMFRSANTYKNIGEPTKVKAIGVPKINVFNGYTSPQFMIEENFIFRG